MRYLVRAKLIPEKALSLLSAIEAGTLGAGSIAGSEYIRDMRQARLLEDGSVRWVEVCYCPAPLEEEIPYWQEYFELTKIMDAHDRRRCLDYNDQSPWACSTCDCTERLEMVMDSWGKGFLDELRKRRPLKIVD